MTLTVVSYGGGNDSTALLIEMVNRGEPPPYAILFADTGGEKPHTYAYVEMFSKWLRERGYPEITVVKNINRYGIFETLEQVLRRTRRLPSIAYGFKTCSQRFKRDPQDKFCNNDPIIKSEWAAGRKIRKVIGYNFDEFFRAKLWTDEKYENDYPLIRWKIGKTGRLGVILAAGLPLPRKSACFFCPHSTKEEIDDLRVSYPELFWRAITLELQATGLRTVAGLGRRFAWWRYWLGVKEPPRPRKPKRPEHNEVPCDCYD